MIDIIAVCKGLFFLRNMGKRQQLRNQSFQIKLYFIRVHLNKPDNTTYPVNTISHKPDSLDHNLANRQRFIC